MKEFFSVNVNKYVPDKNFNVCRPASLHYPKDHSVMFVTDEYLQYANALEQVRECLVFWPKNIEIPDLIQNLHAVYGCDNPRQGYCMFYKDNSITNYPSLDKINIVNGAYIAECAVIGKNCTIFPGAYISGETVLGDGVYIGAGVKLMGRVYIGNRVVVRENTVIGADGLSTDRDDNGVAITMPQFGAVRIEEDVQIGALTVIARGAIDDTIIRKGSKIDNSSFISHNVEIGEDTFIVGETIMFGSSSTGRSAFISGNSTIRNGVHIGEKALVGMGSVVVKSVANETVVKGNPAK